MKTSPQPIYDLAATSEVNRELDKLPKPERAPWVVVKELGWQEGFQFHCNSIPGQMLYNVIGGDVPELMGSTVAIASLRRQLFRVEVIA